MAGTRIPLPKYDALPEGVYFHREDPRWPRVILQIPNEDRSDSESYVLDIEDTIHSAWLEGLKNSRHLLTTMSWARHIAYCPRTGHFEEMSDLDDVSETAKRVALARRDASYAQRDDRFAAHRQSRRAMGPSKLRTALGGRRFKR